MNKEQSEEIRSIGGILLLARTEARLSQDDIAKNLHLSKSYIQHLENDEFDQLKQSAVFIRGYVRSYARIVNVNEDEITRLLNTHGVRDKEVARKHFIPTHKQISVRDKKMRWLTYGIIILFLVLISIWWHSRVSERQSEIVLSPATQQSQAIPGVAKNAADTTTASTNTKASGTTSVSTEATATPDKQSSPVNTNKIVSQLHMDNGGK